MSSLDPKHGSFFDLSDRTKLRLTGADRIRFINGQITNDVRKATEKDAIAACVLNAKGKLNAQVFVSAAADSVVLDSDAELRDSLVARLERYIVADDVQLEDVTDMFSVFHVLGADPNPIAAGRHVSATRFGLPGFDLWIQSEHAAEVTGELSEILPVCDQHCAEQFRIEQGIPRWGKELTEDTIPVEANLEATCIDYEKGCYIGQEVISRMKMSGQRNKGLYGFLAGARNRLTPGMKLWPVDNDTKQAGWITSANWSDRLGQHIGLGYVKRPFNQPGTDLRAKADKVEPIAVRIVDLPFDLSAGVNY